MIPLIPPDMRRSDHITYHVSTASSRDAGRAWLANTNYLQIAGFAFMKVFLTLHRHALAMITCISQLRDIQDNSLKSRISTKLGTEICWSTLSSKSCKFKG